MHSWLWLLLACTTSAPEDTTPPQPEIVDPGPVEVTPPEPQLREVPACPWAASDAVAQAVYAVGASVETEACALGGAQAKAREVRLRFVQDGTYMRVVLKPAACHPADPALPSGWALTTGGTWDGCPQVLTAVKEALESAELPPPNPLDVQDAPPPQTPPARPDLPPGGHPKDEAPPPQPVGGPE